MKQSKRPIAVLAAIAAIGVAAVAPSSFAGGETPPPPPTTKSKCNSGNGNGNESVTTTAHCINGDPGQSYYHNHGGDEYGYQNSLPNPGGNNSVWTP